MTKLPQVSPEDCIKALMKAGFEVSRQRGSQVQMRRNDPPPARTIPVPVGKKHFPVAHYNPLFGNRVLRAMIF